MPARFLVRPDTSDIKAVGEVFKNNSYQRKQFKIEPGEKWLDMGANIGAFSVFAAHVGCEVVSFEAESLNAEATVKNLTLNGFRPQVHQCAIVPDSYVGNTISFFVLSRPMALRRHSIVQPKKDFVRVEVPALRWSDALRQNPGFDCVKLNIEGVEVDIMREAPQFDGVRKMVFEWSFDKDPEIATCVAMLAKLRRYFRYVDISKPVERVGQTHARWDFYPPNAFVYAIR